MRNRIMVCLVLALVFFLVFPVTVSAVDLQPASWSMTDLGTTEIVQNTDDSLRFTYDLNSIAVHSGVWWNLTSTAQATETFDFIYRYNCFHAWYRTEAQLIAFAEGPNGTQSVALYNGSGQITNLIGTSSIEITEGYTFGFRIFASNYDSNPIARGTLDIYNNDPFTITFDSAGGSEVLPITQDYGTEVSAPADPTREGYTFTGWNPVVPATMPLNDATLTAQWTINEYTIDFESAGGSEVLPITQDYGTEVSAPADPTREGYTFTGWNPVVPATMPSGGATLTAQWANNEYTINFDSAGGSAVLPITRDYGTEVSAPADPTREGYTFTGWNPVVPATMPLGGATLTAQWTINEYKVIFLNWDDTPLATQNVPYGGAAAPPANPTRDGYTFAGWSQSFDEISGDLTLIPLFTEEIPATGEADTKILIGVALLLSAAGLGFRRWRSNDITT